MDLRSRRRGLTDPLAHDLGRLRFAKHRPVLALAAMLLSVAALNPAEAAPRSRPASPVSRDVAEADRQARALQRASNAVVGVEVTALAEASTTDALGQQRQGSGVVIGDDGLVLTIGYLLLEADDVALRLDNGRRVPARVVGLDLASGFGLLQPLLPIAVPPAPLAPRIDLAPGEPLMQVSGGEDGAVSVTRLAARRAYSGYWEYHVDHALFTRPARTDHDGAGLFNRRGELLGIGSLRVLDTPAEHQDGPGNLFVPIDLLGPVLAQWRHHGRVDSPARAWLGVDCREEGSGVRVVHVGRDSPAEAAGLAPGDVITGIEGVPVRGLEGFYKQLWRGQAERDLTLRVQRDGQLHELPVHSLDRSLTLRRAPVI